ncbi:spore coat putative kinase YutH [Peribacillus frigoritolerans]|uniref:spore coat putative kinase YutH n=1 Tax=Peribacillus frigoritolerans TaxID=450367 RepID=UPI0025A06BB6|nr:spore coat protein YutH [Peribacillus frigoritolerans]MDM5311946.1 spore coat protein YutH [Peribacillus frigoritolerans]
MIEEIIFNNYGIQVELEEANVRFPSFRSGNMVYSIVPIEDMEQEELVERYKMSQHLISQGDRHVSAFVLANHGSYVSEADEQLFILLANQALEGPRNFNPGRRLARFHQRGRTINETIRTCSRIGKWKELWEQRIDQLEKIWRDKLNAHPDNQFEKLFIETFPYYMVLGENAIQYLVDTEIDDTPQIVDSGTVCYERFLHDTWKSNKWMKNPFDWVFDHGTRDVAEWVREHYFQNVHTHQRGIGHFFHEYQSIEPFSSFSARLLYSRMLFPIHYFETVEEYFSKTTESRSNELEDKIASITKSSQQYESFLKHFYELAEVPAKQYDLPKIDWI